MSATSKRRPVLHGVTVLSLLAGSAYLTVELRRDEQAKAPAVQTITDIPHLRSGFARTAGVQDWERLRNPDRSVLRTGDGGILATFTDGARTATLTGPSRTFDEPANTSSRVVTQNWVRLMPEVWTKGAEKEQWFKDWFQEYHGSERDDLFAFAFQYVEDAPVRTDDEGVPYAGDADYGPLDPNGDEGEAPRLEESDFYDQEAGGRAPPLDRLLGLHPDRVRLPGRLSADGTRRHRRRTAAYRRRHGALPGGRGRHRTVGPRAALRAPCMARTSGGPGAAGGATMFLVDADNPGMKIVRNIDTLDQGLFGGHSEIVFEGCEVGESAVLGEVDQGFIYAQVRLGPARTTHCMRWLGAARRAQDIALERAMDRSAFGGPLAELGMVQQLLADSEIDIETSRAVLWRAWWELDQGRPAAQHTSIAKTYVSEAVNRVVDRAVQVCGALGISGDAPLSRPYREVRPFRIYDGPSETHRWAIAKRAVRAARERRTAP
ncbi:acyl-CoA dehydrogenase family protein [Streptomyces sp. NPDC059863]|uniref:acyl-CoA dehydrogenase family protein n=1 Tax=unclassified Streptomyces TaxID=2593676 RepID=UPI00364A7F21